MKYLMTVHPPEGAAQFEPPSPERMAALAQYTQEMIAAGVVKLTGGIAPVSMGGARVRSKNGEFAVLDGPFTEAKEVVVGFAVIEAASLEEAIALSKSFMAVAGDGEGEIQAIFEGGA